MSAQKPKVFSDGCPTASVTAVPLMQTGIYLHSDALGCVSNGSPRPFIIAVCHRARRQEVTRYSPPRPPRGQRGRRGAALRPAAGAGAARPIDRACRAPHDLGDRRRRCSTDLGASCPRSGLDVDDLVGSDSGADGNPSTTFRLSKDLGRCALSPIVPTSRDSDTRGVTGASPIAPTSRGRDKHGVSGAGIPERVSVFRSLPFSCESGDDRSDLRVFFSSFWPLGVCDRADLG